MTPGRLEAFSDGVLAVAITLLAFQVTLPAIPTGHLAHALFHLWPSYASYALSFAIIGIIWVNHHAMFDRVATVDRTVLFLNLGLLMTVAFLPFPTAVLAGYVHKGGADSHVAAALYSTNMTGIGVFFLALWYHLGRTPGTLVEGFEVQARAALRRTVPGPCIYAASVGLAFVNAQACLVLYAAMAVYFILPDREAPPAQGIPTAGEVSP